jgi:hypothetical protein
MNQVVGADPRICPICQNKAISNPKSERSEDFNSSVHIGKRNEPNPLLNWVISIDSLLLSIGCLVKLTEGKSDIAMADEPNFFSCLWSLFYGLFTKQSQISAFSLQKQGSLKKTKPIRPTKP